ncbi:hypothetical protein GQ53DRAFT_819469 [Thozetella sp. PMI_491]|nr:hypothetical protein GQ53DRAFT_819469 [Thozetella sp. PMI_491]
MEDDCVSIPALPSFRRRQRRVPDQLRKRAALSCDFCKVRRRKCVRDSSAGECKLCRENNVECISTIPRKPRGQAPADDHHARYRVIEDLLGKLLPNISIDDTDELLRLSRAVDVGSSPDPHDHLPLESTTPGTEIEFNGGGSVPQFGASLPVPGAASSLPQEPPASEAAGSSYERMLTNSSGTLSYFGPSSSMAYVRKMRELLALGPGYNTERLPDKQQRLRDHFIQDPYARTMVEGHGEEPQFCLSSYPQRPGVSFDAQQPTRKGSARLARLLEVLPTEDETEQLVDLFFAHVHPNIMLFHRPSFQAMLDRLRMNETREVDAGWAVCFRLVVALGCEWRISSPGPKAQDETDRLASMTERLVSDALSEMSQLMLSATLQSVAAMTLLAVYFSFANERNAAWILSGAAVRMGIGIGLHRGENALRRSNIHLSTTDRELRKQVWCSLFVFEQYTSSLFGRASAVGGIEILVEVPNESILDQGFYRPLGLLAHDISLARIIGKICETQVDQSLSPSNDYDGLPDLDACSGLLRDLDSWKQDLPPFLAFDSMQQDQIYPSHFRQLVMLHVRYQYTRILLSRPFLLKALYVSHATGSSAISDRVLKFKDVCFTAATEAWTLILCLWNKDQYDACLWLDGVFTYQCNLVLSLYLLDQTRTADSQQHQRLQKMVQQMQQILKTGPGNKTMKRLVQISSDFTEIVGSLSSKCIRVPHEDGFDYAGQDAGFAREENAPSSSTPGFDSNASTAIAGREKAAFFNWEYVVEPDLFFGNLVDESSALDLFPTFGSRP